MYHSRVAFRSTAANHTNWSRCLDDYSIHRRTWIINSCRQSREEGKVILNWRKTESCIRIASTPYSKDNIYRLSYLYSSCPIFHFCFCFLLFRIPSNRSIMVWRTCIIRAMFATKMLFILWQSLFDRIANFIGWIKTRISRKTEVNVKGKVVGEPIQQLGTFTIQQLVILTIR
jgi:hypothetical protein